MPPKCLDPSTTILPDYLFKFAIKTADLVTAIGMMPKSLVDFSVDNEGEPLKGTGEKLYNY